MKNRVKLLVVSLIMLCMGRYCTHDKTLTINKLRAILNTKTETKSLAKTVAKDSLDIIGNADTFQRQNGAIVLDWRLLAKTKFTPVKEKTMDGLIVMMPTFPLFMRRIEGQQVQMKGYVIPVEETGDLQTLVLSANPYSMCFFCGQAGPESVMDIQLKNPKSGKRFKKDEKITFQGKLKLNDTDFNYFNYILENAQWVQ